MCIEPNVAHVLSQSVPSSICRNAACFSSSCNAFDSLPNLIEGCRIFDYLVVFLKSAWGEVNEWHRYIIAASWLV
jgi:hypothetical protein